LAFFKSIEAVRILFLSGLLLLVVTFLVRASCRCVPPGGPLAAIRDAGWFRGMFSRHCVLWITFVVLLVIHVIFAAGFIGFPF